MRGKLSTKKGAASAPRITPADAGKTSFFDFGTRCVEDHPRGCGENSVGVVMRVYIAGSPPRMRGKRGGKHTEMGYHGITPADAGKTALVKRSRCGA